MKLIVFYSVNSFDEIDECHYCDDKYILVNAPDNLLQSEYTSYVFQNYFDKIFELEKNCNGSLLVTESDITINSVFYITELN